MPHTESVLPLGVPIAPTEPTDGNSTHIDNYGRGGLHSVADIAARDAIASDRRRVGMVCYVQADSTHYKLTALPNTWATFGGGGNVNVVSGDGITVTESPADTFTVRANFGSAGNTVCEGNDARLSDARPPLSHTHVLANITDAGTIASQDADAVSLTGGTVQGVSAVTGSYSSLLNEATMKLVRKSTSGTITKGQVVYIVGSSGNHLTVELADADSEATAATTIGVAVENITSTTSGYIIVQGYLFGLSNLPVVSFPDGAALWLSQTAGGWTTTPPTQPAHRVFLGWVITNSNGAAGRAYIKVINGQELDELHDVLIGGSPADNDLLAYDSATSLWKNQTAAQAGLAAASHTHAIADVNLLQNALDAKLDDSQATATGLAVLGAATPAAGATALGLGTGDTPTFKEIILENGERIRNTTNGRVEIIPQPSVADRIGITFDLTLRSNLISIGSFRPIDSAVNVGGVYWDIPLQVGNNVDLVVSGQDWSAFRQVVGAGLRQTLCVGVGVGYNFGGTDISSSSFALMHRYHFGLSTRCPSVTHADPHFYVYSMDSTQANDFVRMSHDQTDGVIESGNGDLRLVAPGEIRFNGNLIQSRITSAQSRLLGRGASSGSGQPQEITIGSGLSLTGTTLSATGGGGGVTEDFAIAMAVAL